MHLVNDIKKLKSVGCHFRSNFGQLLTGCFKLHPVVIETLKCDAVITLASYREVTCQPRYVQMSDVVFQFWR